jgi:hypothetical protein
VGLREPLVTGRCVLLTARHERLGEQALAARRADPALELVEQSGTHTAAAVVGVGHQVGVGDGGVVLQRHVHQDDSDQRAGLADPEERYVEVGALSR